MFQLLNVRMLRGNAVSNSSLKSPNPYLMFSMSGSGSFNKALKVF